MKTHQGTNFQMGRVYKTHGGWDALVVWVAKVNGKQEVLLVSHKPFTDFESLPTFHDADGRSVPSLEVVVAPRYGQPHPADLVVGGEGRI